MLFRLKAYENVTHNTKGTLHYRKSEVYHDIRCKFKLLMEKCEVYTKTHFGLDPHLEHLHTR